MVKPSLKDLISHPPPTPPLSLSEQREGNRDYKKLYLIQPIFQLY